VTTQLQLTNISHQVGYVESACDDTEIKNTDWTLTKKEKANCSCIDQNQCHSTTHATCTTVKGISELGSKRSATGRLRYTTTIA